MPFDFILFLLKILSLACDIRFTFSEILILFTLERPVSLLTPLYYCHTKERVSVQCTMTIIIIDFYHRFD